MNENRLTAWFGVVALIGLAFTAVSIWALVSLVQWATAQ